MPGACYSSGLSKRGTKSMRHPRGVFPSRTPSQFSTKAHRNSGRYAISLPPSRLQHRIMGSPGKDKQSMIALPHSQTERLDDGDWGEVASFSVACNSICLSVLKERGEEGWKRDKGEIKREKRGQGLPSKWFYCWIGALWYTHAAVALSLPLLPTCLLSQWRPGYTHSHTHTHTFLHWSFWTSPYVASAKAPAVHHPQLPWQQSCTQTACRLAMWPWMQAHPHTHILHTHTHTHTPTHIRTITNTS